MTTLTPLALQPATNTAQQAPVVSLYAPDYDPCSSYGRLANELRSSLKAQGAYVNALGYEPPQDDPIRMTLGGIFLGYPTLYDGWSPFGRLGPRISVTMFESTKLPSWWVENLNRMGRVIVPSRSQVDIFRANGVTAPVRVVPLGVSKAFHGYSERPTESPFTFLCIGDGGRRKNWEDAAFAFVEAFGDDPNYKLIIKARSGVGKLGNPNIQFIGDDYTDDQMAALYRRCHVMVFASRGEGFALPPREFAATGGLSIATNWSGMSDDLSMWGLPLPYTMTPAWTKKPEWAGKLGQWAEPDFDALIDLMKHVAKHFDAYADFRKRAAGFCLTNYRWSLFGRAVYDAWNEVARGH